MRKVLGGDRLGAGKKMDVDLHGYNRSTHDLGYIWRSTMAAGTLVPFLVEPGLPGDTFDINLDCDIKTHPTVGPLFGSYKVQLDVFTAAIRLYQGELHNNKLGIGMNMANIKLPQMVLRATHVNSTNTQDFDNAQINPSCILSYLNIRGVGMIDAAVTPGAETERMFNALALLMYWDAYKNYYANKQEEIGAVIHTTAEANVETVDTITAAGGNVPQVPGTAGIFLSSGSSNIVVNFTGATPIPEQIIFNVVQAGVPRQLSYREIVTAVTSGGAGILTGTYNFSIYGPISVISWDYISGTGGQVIAPQVVTFELGSLDNMREEILRATSDITPFIVNDVHLFPYEWLLAEENGKNTYLNTQEGLGIKTYQSDLFNNWLSTEWIDGPDGITEVTSIDTSGGSFSIDTLNLSKKVYDMLNRIAVSGGSYDDWQDAVWAHDRYTRAETPVYVGGLIKELVFQEVVSNSENTGISTPTQPLGTLAGKGVLAKKHKGGHITVKVDEPSYLMGIISLTPRIDYSQGNKWDTQLKTMDDFHKPALDEIGFQELIQEQMAWWTTQKDADGQPFETKSAGKQPAWINYMTNVNQVRGNFAIESNEMFMTLNRKYEWDDGNINDLTTYIDPVKFNNIFAQTSLDAQNFWAQIAVNMTVRRKISAKVMPNL